MSSGKRLIETPKPEKRKRKHRTAMSARSVAYGGVLSALALVFIILGGYLGVGTFIAPMLAGFTTGALCVITGRGTAAVQWAAVGILGVLLCSDKELAALYLLLFGWYPLVRGEIDHIMPGIFGRLVKALLFNGAVLIIYAMLVHLIYGGLWQNAGFGGAVATVCALIVGNIIFQLYDTLLGRLETIITGKA